MRKCRSGFTLIELLVVIAIIVVLISILLPSLGRAREKAKLTVCMSNLAQIRLSLYAYMDEWGGYMPDMYNDPSYYAPMPGLQIDTPTARGWSPTLIPSYCSSRKVFFCPTLSSVSPQASNPNNTNPWNLCAYGLMTDGVSRKKLDTLDASSILPSWAGPAEYSDKGPYLIPSNIPIVLEWASVHRNASGDMGMVAGLFADGSVRLVDNSKKSTAPCEWHWPLYYFRIPPNQ